MTTTPMPELPVVAYYYSRNKGKSWHLTEKDPTDLMPDSDGIVTPLCKVSDAIAAIAAATEQGKRHLQWLPIADAPRDGTIVCFYVPGKKVPTYCRADDLLAKPYWLEGATHFMHLPLPPTGTGGDKNRKADDVV